MDIRNITSNLPLVTDFPSRAHWEAAIWEILIDRIARVQSAADLKKILHFLVTTGERHDIIYRALTGSRIVTGIGPREIGRELWVSRATISAIKKSLLEGEYKSSHARGHQKKIYTPDGPPKEEKMQRPLTMLGEVRRGQRAALRRRRKK